jgi:hypothetical protein
MKIKILIIVFVIGLSLVLVGAALAINGFEISRSVLSGGASESTSGGISLDGTLGQPFVGSVSSGEITLEQGFWHGSGSNIFLPLVQK